VRNAQDIFKLDREVQDPELRSNIESLIDSLKNSILRLREEGPSEENIILDLYGENNLLISSEDGIRYVDTGLGPDWNTDGNDISNHLLRVSDSANMYMCQIAFLEALIGRSLFEVFADEFYTQDFVAEYFIEPLAEGELSIDLPPDVIERVKAVKLGQLEYSEEEVEAAWGVEQKESGLFRRELKMLIDMHRIF
jgi:hypothetical protein